MAAATEDVKNSDEKVDGSGSKDKDSSEILDPKRESEVLNKIFDVAFRKIDYKTGKEVNDESIKWDIFNTKDENSNVIYRLLDKEIGVITVRGEAKIPGLTLDEAYDYFDSNYTTFYDFSKSVNDLMEGYKIIKVYDSDHHLVCSTYSAGMPKWMMSWRDYLMIGKRVKYDNYIPNADNGGDGKEDDKCNIVGAIWTSADEKHKDFVKQEGDNVRGLMHYCGYFFVEKNNEVSLILVLCADPCGNVPQRVVNFAAPSEGMLVKEYAKNVDKIKKLLSERKKK